jgi:hypothetical protein
MDLGIANFRAFGEKEALTNIIRIGSGSTLNLKVSEDLKNYVKVCDLEDLTGSENEGLGSLDLYRKCIDKFVQVQTDKYVGSSYPFLCVLKEKGAKLDIEWRSGETTTFEEVMNRKFETIRQTQAGVGRRTPRADQK